MSERAKGRGGPGRGQGRKPRNKIARDKLNVRLDPDLRILVQWHANAREQTVTESVNQLLAEALHSKEVDAEAQEVL